MKLIEKYSQYRRDCYIKAQCENCSHVNEKISAYDDNYYWTEVLPDTKCDKCGESTNSLGIVPDVIKTKYPEGYIV